MRSSKYNLIIFRQPRPSNVLHHLLSKTLPYSLRQRDRGFSLVYFLTATLIIIAGTATLLNQSTSAFIGSVFEGQSLQARNVGKSGLRYLISQINKENNRHLMAVLKSQIDSNPNVVEAIWTDDQAASYHFNPCNTTHDAAGLRRNQPPNLADLNIGINRLNDGYFFIDNNGVITKTRNGANRAFRIINRNAGKDFRLARKDNLFLLDDTQNKGSFRLSVEALVYRNGQSNEVVSRTILQEDFSVIPKCCKVPFGGYLDANGYTWKGHGNTIYAITKRTNLLTNSCMLPGVDPNGFGVVVGAGGRGGFIDATGGPTIKHESGIPVNPVYCVSTDLSQCNAAYNDSNNQMDRLDIELPPPPKYPGSWSGPAPELNACISLDKCPSNASGKSGANQLMQYTTIGSTKQTTFNAAAVTSTTELPSNCTLQRNDIHCIFSKINISSNENIVFVSGNNTRQIRFYFPEAGSAINQTGNGAIRHCKNTNCTSFVGNVTDLSFFGAECPVVLSNPDCGAQAFNIKGSANATRLYIFAPEATIKLTGSAAFLGIIWAKGIDMTGTTAAPIVPKTGVADAFILMGILPDEYNTFNKSLTGSATTTDLFAWDMVARSTSRYRFLGN